MSVADQAGIVIGIFGPTGSGKSALAEAIAGRIPAELVSADSAQVYRGLPLLTNQSPAQLVAIWDLDHEASVGEYQRLAHAAIDEILATGKTPLVVGGTGLYMRAALADLRLPPPPGPGVRQRFEGLYDELGAEGAHGFLADRDPRAAAAVHPNDRRRVVRALELAALEVSLQPVENRLWTLDTRHSTLLVGLDVPSDLLDARIEERTRRMFTEGVQEEVAVALSGAISTTARRVLGLDEIATLSRDEAIAAVVRRTRRLARYQSKWMRRMVRVTVRGDRPTGEIADQILEMVSLWEHVPPRRDLRPFV